MPDACWPAGGAAAAAGSAPAASAAAAVPARRPRLVRIDIAVSSALSAVFASFDAWCRASGLNADQLITTPRLTLVFQGCGHVDWSRSRTTALPSFCRKRLRNPAIDSGVKAPQET